MTDRQMRDAVYSQNRILAQACEDINTLRDKFEAAGAHDSILYAMDEAINSVSAACKQLDSAESMLRQAPEQADKS
jgi:hypothetical protein